MKGQIYIIILVLLGLNAFSQNLVPKKNAGKTIMIGPSSGRLEFQKQNGPHINKKPIKRRYFVIVYVYSGGFGDFTIRTNGNYPSKKYMINSAKEYCMADNVIITNVWELCKKDFIDFTTK